MKWLLIAMFVHNPGLVDALGQTLPNRQYLSTGEVYTDRMKCETKAGDLSALEQNEKTIAVLPGVVVSYACLRIQ